MFVCVFVGGGGGGGSGYIYCGFKGGYGIYILLGGGGGHPKFG